MPTIQRNDTTLYYEVHGAGYPVVFVHGGGGNTMAFYQQVPHFRDRYQVITVDLRGFKQSVCAPGVVSHPIDYPDDLRAILDAENISSAALVCQSLGAWAGLPLAVRNPERVSCLFINGSPTPAYSEKNWQTLRRATGIFNDTAAKRDAGIGWNRRTVRERPEVMFLYSQIKQLNPGFDSTSMMDDCVKLHPEDMAGYKVPTMIAGGSHDDFLNPESHLHVATLIPGAASHTFPDTGHSTYFEDADAFNQVLDAFLSRHVTRGVAAS
ncbi:alpha/beta fold hydrolase [Cupriavidus numazuensis]|uniref:AB hydrolase superfamily protein YdjP n=1 Tax=Cupriavidus numazuensis TaxID=221992 RepID=A0ABM8TEZ9_9BURK|nr:alpha/beta hydrolase [Cupriavidus numazuensis]CAG2141144.1 AB hydrolase superfamily protein YdjP [Cupriavidus numazuensis]